MRDLGKTGIKITPIGLGIWQFSQGKSFNRWIWKSLTEDNQNAIIQAALDGGINWFDTAETYGFGQSERGLSQALQTAGIADDEVIVATKWNPIGRTAASIPRTINKRLANLAPYSIDLYQVHNPFSFSKTEEEMAEMACLLVGGKFRAIGVSNFNAGQMLRAHRKLGSYGLPLASNQVKYSLLDRKIESNGVLESARALGITIIAYTPLEWGLLTGKYHDNPDLIKGLPLARRMYLGRKLEESAPVIAALREIGAKYEATPGQVSLNWLINFHGPIVVAIPGASKPQHAKEAAGVMDFTLSEEELARLDALTRQNK